MQENAIRMISSALEKKHLSFSTMVIPGCFTLQTIPRKGGEKFQYVNAPPTSAPAKFHRLRVYYQVQEWRGEAGHLDPEEWGWKITNRLQMPVKTSTESRCNCKTQEGAPARSMGCNAHLHVANAKDSVVQILQSLSARVTWITWRISMDFE